MRGTGEVKYVIADGSESDRPHKAEQQDHSSGFNSSESMSDSVFWVKK